VFASVPMRISAYVVGWLGAADAEMLVCVCKSRHDVLLARSVPARPVVLSMQIAILDAVLASEGILNPEFAMHIAAIGVGASPGLTTPHSGIFSHR